LDYLSPLPPGSPLAHPTPERGSREHFAVVTGRVERIDWLDLAVAGHRRAVFDATGARWIQP
jgi:pyridoxamine 5'-phosphate oxidase